MYTKKQVDEVLSQVEREFEKTLGSIAKSENIEEEITEEVVEAEVEEVAKSEEEVEIEEDDSEFETIDELYASMDKSEKEAHYASIKKSLFGEVEEVEEELVSEKTEETMTKSENEVKLETENDELKKSLESLNELVGKLFNTKKAPAQKAITNANYIAKSEEGEEESSKIEKMSKGEITSKLKSIDYSEMSKSDRNAINDYCLQNTSIESIKHLIV